MATLTETLVSHDYFPDIPQAEEFNSQTAGNRLSDLYGNKFEFPDFTIKQIRDAIPRHCFQRSALTSLYYVARDSISLAVTFAVFYYCVTPDSVPSTAVRSILWILYSVIQGLFGTGLWVIGHECGHQAFSRFKLLNDFVGFVCHSFVLVPYFSFKLSHRQHHKATGNISRDVGFVPMTKAEFATRLRLTVNELNDLTEEIPFFTAVNLLGQQLLGWPLYLLTNVSSNNNHEAKKSCRGKGKHNGLFGGVNHFNPSSPLFEAQDANVILLSDLGLFLMASFLGYIGTNFSWSNLFVWYGLPYLWVNHWIAAITFLQHTDASIPHYEPQAWSFCRGACATVDRDMGFIGRHIFHRGTDTHVLHHFVSTIPFYHAAEATEAIRKVMGRHYRKSENTGLIGFLKDLWKNYRLCQWVEPVDGAEGEKRGVLFYRSRNSPLVPDVPRVDAAGRDMNH
ncbi:medium-chain fatty acid ethyl ester synthase/esterase 2 [Paecilomyces lecythidis]|uniref:Medium-chain fatty acid ethyl ester synthase/esterase 2 n=1 Tax=Paecilomyces lecythidis TaxID=3004212 RepID=A0ABR3WW89_9EURO